MILCGGTGQLGSSFRFPSVGVGGRATAASETTPQHNAATTLLDSWSVLGFEVHLKNPP